jgi:hypothetical protein
VRKAECAAAWKVGERVVEKKARGGPVRFCAPLPSRLSRSQARTRGGASAREGGVTQGLVLRLLLRQLVLLLLVSPRDTTARENENNLPSHNANSFFSATSLLPTSPPKKKKPWPPSAPCGRPRPPASPPRSVAVGGGPRRLAWWAMQ